MESYVSLGMSLPVALERVDESLGIRVSHPPGGQPVTAAVPTPAQNEASLAQLNALLGGVTVR